MEYNNYFITCVLIIIIFLDSLDNLAPPKQNPANVDIEPDSNCCGTGMKLKCSLANNFTNACIMLFYSKSSPRIFAGHIVVEEVSIGSSVCVGREYNEHLVIGLPYIKYIAIGTLEVPIIKNTLSGANNT